MNTSYLGRDWFIGAIEANGTVHQCLQKLADELDFKKTFVQELMLILHKDKESKLDDISLLHQQCRQLLQTLSVRLSLLSPERETAWFRRSISPPAGPFTPSVFQDPVFFSYDFKTSEPLEKALVSAFEKSEAPPTELWTGQARESAIKGEHCLWTRLLTYNHRLKHHSHLNIPMGSLTGAHQESLQINLEKIDESTILPGILESRPLRAFLMNIQGELKSIRSVVNQCFQCLHHGSSQLWSFQRKVKKTAADPGRFTNPREIPPQDRDQKQRQQTQGDSQDHESLFLLARERDCLRFMGFDYLPSIFELRKKYRELAKKMHPDIHPGQDQSFKRLVESYKILQKKISIDL